MHRNALSHAALAPALGHTAFSIQSRQRRWGLDVCTDACLNEEAAAIAAAATGWRKQVGIAALDCVERCATARQMGVTGVGKGIVARKDRATSPRSG